MDALWLADRRTVSVAGLGADIGPANAAQAARDAQAAVFRQVASRSVCVRVERVGAATASLSAASMTIAARSRC